MNRIELCITASLAEWERLGERIRAFCLSQGIPEEDTGRILLACEEWIVNIIRHGYGEGAAGSVQITLELTEHKQPEPDTLENLDQGSGVRRLIVTITDEAQSFDPLQHPDPDLTLPLEQRALGGLGIWLMKQSMNQVVYERKEERNVLRMVKSCRAE
ncbi:ATP-binding protein [Paenibacillus daejeonensis]|uniref:ATP-binding protein n=1 Tax=Paenibacillus daejeonensis TaxID=135193 RepID=UPI000368411E|nr:ATP-binding protein [Paenibacillus daejeonensis]